MLQEVTHDMHVFGSEIDSYNLPSFFHHPQTLHIGLSHDTAFFVSRAGLHVQDKSGGYILVAPWLDRESVMIWRRENMWRTWRAGYVCKDVNLLATFESFVDVAANARKVYTDRLHVSTLAAILGKETYSPATKQRVLRQKQLGPRTSMCQGATRRIFACYLNQRDRNENCGLHKPTAQSPHTSAITLYANVVHRTSPMLEC